MLKTTKKLFVLLIGTALLLGGCELLEEPTGDEPPVEPPTIIEEDEETSTLEEKLAAQSKIIKFEDYDEMIQEQFIWTKIKIRLNKLKPFIEYEPQKIRLVMRGIWLQPTS